MAVGLTFEMLSIRGSTVSGPTAQWNSTLWFYSNTRRGNYGVFNPNIMRPISKALSFLRGAAKRRQTVLFSGTTHEEKRSPGAFPNVFLKQHWVGGFLTNYQMLRQKYLTAMEITDVFDFLTVFLVRRLLEKLRVFEIRSTRRMLGPTIRWIREFKRISKRKVKMVARGIIRNFRFLQKLIKGKRKIKRKRKFFLLKPKRRIKPIKAIKRRRPKLKKKKRPQAAKDYLHLYKIYLMRLSHPFSYLFEEEPHPMFFASNRKSRRVRRRTKRKFFKLSKKIFLFFKRGKYKKGKNSEFVKQLQKFITQKPRGFLRKPFLRRYSEKIVNYETFWNFEADMPRLLLVGRNKHKLKKRKQLSLRLNFKYSFCKFLLLKRIPSVIVSTDLNGSNYFAMNEAHSMKLPYIAPVSTLDGYAGIPYFMPLGRLDKKQALFYHVFLYRIVLRQYKNQTSKYLFWRNW